MILLLRGGDELALRRRIQELKAEADGGTGMLTTNLTQVEGKDARPEDILGPAMTPPFLAPKRLVLVERFLDRWESDWAQREDNNEETEGESQRRAPRQPRGLGPFETMAAAFEKGLPPTSLVVLTGGEPKRQNAMVARLKNAPDAKEELYAAPRKDQLLRFIRDEGATRGIRFRTSRATQEHWESDDWTHRPESDPITLIAAITEGETLAIANELDKLALYTMGREVTVDDVYTVSSGDREITQFNFLDAIQDGKAGDALHHLDRLRERGDVWQLLVTLLTTRFRQTAQVAELMEEHASEDEIGRAMGNAGKYPGLRQPAMRRARRYGLTGSRAALAAIAEMDYRSKKGEIDDEVGLEILVVKLARMAAAGQ